jgi:hypothetical protein
VPFNPLAATYPVQRLAEHLQGQWLAEQRARVHRAAGEQVDGRAETAQDRHRAGDSDLVVVDTERREADRGLGGRHAEDQQPAAAVQQPGGGIEHRGHAGRVDRDLEALAIERGDVGGDLRSA